MTDRWQNRVSEYIDGELTPSETLRFEKHLEGCDECLVTMRELKRVVAHVAHLPQLQPPERVWTDLAHKIEGQTPGSAQRGARRTAPRFASRMSLLVAACAALMMISAGAGWWMRGAQPVAVDDFASALNEADSQELDFDSDAIRNALAAGVSRSQLSPKMQEAFLQYERSVVQLEAALTEMSGQMDTTTMEAITGNLEIIDQAIFEARVALSEDPRNDYLSSHLANSMQRKLRLLTRATRLASNEI